MQKCPTSRNRLCCPELALYSVLAEALGITAPHILLFGAKRERFPSARLAASPFHESLTGEIRRGNQILDPVIHI